MDQQSVYNKPHASISVWRRFGVMVVGGAVGALISGGTVALLRFLMGHSGGKALHSIHSMPFWAVVGGILLLCFLVIALHELGHLAAGILVGFRPYLYVAGPLRIDWDDQQQHHIRLHRDFGLYGGLCATLPIDTESLSQRFAIAVLGGPLMSLACSVVSLALAVGLPTVRLPFAFLCTLSLGICVVTAIPMRNGAFLTDGARWLQLRRGGPLAERDAALLYLMAVSMTDLSPAEWPEDILQAVTAVEDGSIFEAAGRYFRYVQALHRGDIREAGAQLDRILQLVAPLSAALQANYRVEAAWFFAWYRLDTTQAQAHLNCVGSQPVGVRESEILTARSAIAYRSGNAEDGRRLLTEATRALPTGKAPLVYMSRTRLERMSLAYPINTVPDNLQVV